MRRKQLLGAVAAIVAMTGAVVAGIAAPALFAPPGSTSESPAPASHAFSTGVGARSSPAEALAAAVEATAGGRPQELTQHFVQRSVAGAFYEAWHGKIPAGTARVAKADQMNAGAEHGHTVPVTVWVTGENGAVAGLKGRARFTPGEGGVQIREAQLEALSLQVGTWDEAARRIAVAQPSLPHPSRRDAPFYGQFRFTAGQRRFAVDALTGRVEAE